MKFGKKLTALFSCALAAVFTFGVAGCGDNDSGGSKPVDPEHYNYNRFDDNANFNKAIINFFLADSLRADFVGKSS